MIARLLQTRIISAKAPRSAMFRVVGSRVPGTAVSDKVGLDTRVGEALNQHLSSRVIR